MGAFLPQKLTFFKGGFHKPCRHEGGGGSAKYLLLYYTNMFIILFIYILMLCQIIISERGETKMSTCGFEGGKLNICLRLVYKGRGRGQK